MYTCYHSLQYCKLWVIDRDVHEVQQHCGGSIILMVCLFWHYLHVKFIEFMSNFYMHTTVISVLKQIFWEILYFKWWLNSCYIGVNMLFFSWLMTTSLTLKMTSTRFRVCVVLQTVGSGWTEEPCHHLSLCCILVLLLTSPFYQNGIHLWQIYLWHFYHWSLICSCKF